MTRTPFLGLLPHSIAADEQIAAVAKALEPVLASSDKAIASILIMARLSGSDAALSPALFRLVEKAGGLKALEEELLDLLAWQFHVDGYEAASSLSQKRRMVQDSIPIHRRRGTPWAVKAALEAVLERAVEVREWFDYGGEPYHFRISFDTSDSGLSPELVTDVWRLITLNKNKRSWCQGLHISSSVNVPVLIRTALTEHLCSRGCLAFAPTSPPALKIHFHAALSVQSFCRSTLGFPSVTPALSARPAGAVITIIRSEIYA